MGDWRSVVAQVARMPKVAERLLAEHQPDQGGRCRGCTTPGRGTPQTLWPCGLHALGAAAIALHETPDGLDRDAAQPS